MIEISVAVMHHPARAGLIGRLLRDTAPLAPRIVPDPDPDGVRSPLRTAKRAWAAIAPDATHHLVLQDDVGLSADFAGQLRSAIAQRPNHAVALYSHWRSPQNSYLVRRAAAAGASWAPLSDTDWAPALGLVLPAPLARDLAAYLAPIPDAVADDDQMIARFCRERGVPMVATVPHLVDESEVPSLTPGHLPGCHATVFAGGRPLPPGHWVTDAREDKVLAASLDYIVEVRESRCVLRLPLPTEPSGHEYGWYWHDWCGLLGVDPDEVRRMERPGHLPGRVVTELQAAGFLLGADVAAIDLGAPGAWLTEAVASWVGSGLTAEDRDSLGAEGRAELVDLAVKAVAHGGTCGRNL
ncbi:hypothetical protein AB0L06_33890 [Spirillospora sp. NPDC052269]